MEHLQIPAFLRGPASPGQSQGAPGQSKDFSDIFGGADADPPKGDWLWPTVQLGAPVTETARLDIKATGAAFHIDGAEGGDAEATRVARGTRSGTGEEAPANDPMPFVSAMPNLENAVVPSKDPAAGSLVAQSKWSGRSENACHDISRPNQGVTSDDSPVDHQMSDSDFDLATVEIGQSVMMQVAPKMAPVDGAEVETGRPAETRSPADHSDRNAPGLETAMRSGLVDGRTDILRGGKHPERGVDPELPARAGSAPPPTTVAGAESSYTPIPDRPERGQPVHSRDSGSGASDLIRSSVGNDLRPDAVRSEGGPLGSGRQSSHPEMRDPTDMVAARPDRSSRVARIEGAVPTSSTGSGMLATDTDLRAVPAHPPDHAAREIGRAGAPTADGDVPSSEPQIQIATVRVIRTPLVSPYRSEVSSSPVRFDIKTAVLGNDSAPMTKIPDAAGTGTNSTATLAPVVPAQLTTFSPVQSAVSDLDVSTNSILSETIGDTQLGIMDWPDRFEMAGGSNRTAGPAIATAHSHSVPESVQARLGDLAQRHAGQTIEIALTPEELGRVRMSFTTHDGTIMMTIQADRPETLELLRRNIDVLAEDFRDLGYQDLSFAFGRGDGSGKPAERDASADVQPPVSPAVAGLNIVGTSERAVPYASGSDGRLDVRL